MTRRGRSPQARRASVALALAAGLFAGVGTTAAAAPTPGPGGIVFPSQGEVDAAKAAAGSAAATVESLEAAYREANTRLAQVQAQESAATEAFNEARLALEASTARAEQARAQADATRAAADVAERTARQYAAQMYTEQGSLGGVEAYLTSSGPQQVADRASALQSISDARSRVMADAADAANAATEADRLAERAQTQRQQAADGAEAAKGAAAAASANSAAAAARIGTEQAAMVAKLAELRSTSVAVEQARQDGLAQVAAAEEAARKAAEDKARAEAAAKAAQDAAAKAAAQAAAREAAANEAAANAAAQQAARQAAAPAPAPAPAPSPAPAQARTGGMDAVIAFAAAQVGKAYIWGGEGPNGYDCSGLVMMAFRQSGIYLPHGSQAQYGLGTKIPLSQARPGDLVFYGASGATNHHVGIYVGNGRMINALNSNAGIRYDSIYLMRDLLPYVARF